jgi:uncharacterized Zn finger protein
MSYYGFRPYVPVAVRREKAGRELAKLAKTGRVTSPVKIEGRKIASTFWGKAWCDNLESYSDFANRLPRGRTYVRNGSVVDLQIERGRVRATVSGSSLYTITIGIGVLPKPRWEAICRDCAGSVGSVVELLQGKLSKNVMERVCRAGDGLFPSPGEIELKCSCPDYADMCKHVAAVLYGVGARLDAKPDLLFELRGVDRSQLISHAGKDLPLTQRPVDEGRVLAGDDVAALFGIEIGEGPVEDVAAGKVETPIPAPRPGRPPKVVPAPVVVAAKSAPGGARVKSKAAVVAEVSPRATVARATSKRTVAALKAPSGKPGRRVPVLSVKPRKKPRAG